MPLRPLDIFLTGATGFLGHYLLTELLAREQVRCHVLLRPELSDSRRRLGRLVTELGLDIEGLMAAGRVILVEGELPGGLESAGLGPVDMIVHAAGSTCFEATPGGEPLRSNVEGTRAMLSFASRVGARRFVYVSTAYVCGERRGRVAEDVVLTPPAFRNAYEESKWQAEQEVWRWARDGRVATICRPSILFGDVQRGRATTMKGLYLIARATEILARAVDQDPQVDARHIPLRIRGRADATANVVPVCWAARHIARIALNERLQGAVHHITNPTPLEHGTIKRWLEAYFAIGGGTFTGCQDPIADPNHYEELFYALGDTVGDYFRQGLTFASALIDETEGAQPLVTRDYFLRSLRYAQDHHWRRFSDGTKQVNRRPKAFDPERYFREFLPRVLPRSSVARVQALTTVVRFIITGAFESQWVCRFEKGRLAELCRGSNGLSEQFGYRVTGDGFAQLVSGRKSLQAAFFQGQAEMFGNIDRALRMLPIISEFIKEFPVDLKASDG